MSRSEELQKQIQELSAEREAAFADFKERGLKLTREYEAAVAEEAAAATVANMSEAEREAMKDALNQSINPGGVPSDATVGDSGTR